MVGRGSRRSKHGYRHARHRYRWRHRVAMENLARHEWMSGEFGHVPIEPEGHSCGCGSHGCAEQYASATAVVRMAPKRSPAACRNPCHGRSFGCGVQRTINLQSGDQGDEDARRIFRRFGKALGCCLRAWSRFLNLDMFVIVEEFRALGGLCPTMFEELRERSLVYAATAPEDSFGKRRRALRRKFWPALAARLSSHALCWAATPGCWSSAIGPPPG